MPQTYTYSNCAPCCGVECITDCECCPQGTARVWTLVVSDVTGNVCISCDNVNGIFALAQTIGCTFESSSFNVCTVQYFWRLSCVSSRWAVELVDLVGNVMAIYWLPDGIDFSCDSIMTFEKKGVTTLCTFPSSVVIFPAGPFECDVTIPCCLQNIPVNVNASIGTINFCSCASTMADIPLTYNSTTGKWEGSGPFGSCGRDLILAFYCRGGGTAVTDLFLDISFSDNCKPLQTTGVTPVANSCDPLMVTFAASLDNVCGCAVNGEIRIIITE